MCVYIGSDVVLANLLYYSTNAEEGVSFADIEEYCGRVKDTIRKNAYQIDLISFQIDNYQLNYSLRLYPNYFKKFVGKYYKGNDLDIEYFKGRLNSEMNIILRSVAEAM